MDHLDETAWVPSSCTLPTAAQPLRVAEFDRLFAQDAIGLAAPDARTLRIELRPGADVAGRAAGLAVRETGCCAFFEFGVLVSNGQAHLTISADEGHAAVLAALRERAEDLISEGAA